MYRLLISQADVPVSWPSRQQITVKVRAWGGCSRQAGKLSSQRLAAFQGDWQESRLLSMFL